MKVAKIVTDCMNNYLLFGLLLQVHLIQSEHVHPKLWKGYYKYKPVDHVQIERKQHNQVGDIQPAPKRIKFDED